MTNSGKIALVRSTYTPYGGVERVTIGLAKGLLQKKIKVFVLTLPNQQWPINDPNLSVVHLGVHSTHRLHQAWSFNKAVNQYLSQSNFDCILSLDKVTRFTHLHAGGGTHKTFLKIRNNYSPPLQRLFRKLSPFHRYQLYLERRGFENPLLQKVRCNSNMVRTDICNDYKVSPEKLVVIHSGIRWKEMEDIYRRRAEIGAQMRRKYNIDPDWRPVLFLGSGFERKGLDIAIQGLRWMPSSYHLVVVGKGSPFAYVRLADKLGVKQRVHFLGPQPQGWRFATFCKALILPSYYDPFGGASAEGHAMGLPVLLSDTTGYQDFVSHGENGIILKTPMTAENVRSAFTGLIKLIESPKFSQDKLRQHAYHVDDDVILERLLGEFLAF
ncbi:MAG: glycosyltransferase family 4 protein [Desulfobacteraceae bacterium]|nr:glycosyltransferase family 4 protein [Desulfobacteraceae bacterium]